MDIFTKLIGIRKSKKINLTDMGGYLGIDRRSVYNYEKGKRKVPYEVVVKYAERFGYELKLMVI
jgi:predicted transcriptional regulator